MESQVTIIYEILKDGKAHSTYQITARMFNSVDTTKIGMWRLGAKISDLGKKGHEVKGFWGEENGKRVYFYQLVYDNQKAIEKLDNPDFDNLMKEFKPEIGNTRHAEIIRLRSQMMNAENKQWFRKIILTLMG
jgi:hypothetical protein